MKKKDVAKNKRSGCRRILWSLTGFLFVSALIGGYIFYMYIVSGLPSLEQLENPTQSLASNVYSVDGELIGQFFAENRIETDIDSLPSNLINALISTEDRKFYDHWGVDLERFAKAMIKNVVFFSREGASTITQQLSKNLFELKEGQETLFDTIVRKLREWLTAIQIEKTYTKREILEMYFNESFFGNRAYGIETAARVYFRKPASELSVEESAVLIALLKSSVYYDPVKRPENSQRRRNVVLFNMYQVGHITRSEYDSLKALPLKLDYEQIKHGFKSKFAPHYLEYVRQQLRDLSKVYNFNIYQDGLTIYTSLDSRLQSAAVSAVTSHLDEFQKTFDKYWNWRRNRDILDDLIDKAIKNRTDYINASSQVEKRNIYDKLKKNVAFVDSVQLVGQEIEVGFVCVDVKTGEIRAMVGGRNQGFAYGLNHVTQIKRQPGSSFKPIIYTVAFDNGLYPAFPMLNQPFMFPAGDGTIWSPRNFDRETGGYMTLRDAIKSSVNLVAARLVIEGHVPLWQIGLYAEKMGIKSKLTLVEAIALGAAEVRPLELVSVYATIANHGIYNEPISIMKIEDKDGVLIDNFTTVSREAISEETAYIITDMLETVINEGTGRGARSVHGFTRPAAGKTGTTNDYADAWFMGFTPQLAAGVWVGFNDRRVRFTGSYGQGGRAAMPIWAKFMKTAYDTLDLEMAYFKQPASGNVVTATFCKESILELGDPKLYSPDCNSGKIKDIIKLNDLPKTFNAERDTLARVFKEYLFIDSLSHQAIEIPE